MIFVVTHCVFMYFQGNVLCPEGSDSGMMVIRLCFSVVVMTLVSGIMTLCAWHLWMKRRKEKEQDLMERHNLMNLKIPPPEIPPPKKILLPKDMQEHLCFAA